MPNVRTFFLFFRGIFSWKVGKQSGIETNIVFLWRKDKYVEKIFIILLKAIAELKNGYSVKLWPLCVHFLISLWNHHVCLHFNIVCIWLTRYLPGVSMHMP